jgi:alanine racemase
MNRLPLEHPVSTRLVCRVDIRLDALDHNLAVLKRSVGDADVVAMVKANAYGHGAVAVARHLEKAGVKWFGVATVDEGIDLREAGVEARILVMAGSGAQFFVPELIANRLTPLLSSLDEVRAVSAAVSELKLAEPFAIHLDLDTGMSRGGFCELDGNEIFEHSKGLHIEGVSSHFAKAEQPDCLFTKQQITYFAQKIEKIVRSGHDPLVIHVDKSASLLTSDRPKFEGMKTLVRPGLAQDLQPVLSWRAPIVLRKNVPQGTPIGYDSTFVTARRSDIALVRVGYADGLNRRLSNRGYLLVDGVKAPLLGRISMDLSVIDVTDVVTLRGDKSCEVGRFATIIGGDGACAQSASDLAQICDTIPYEILTWISARVERFVI